MSHPDFQVKIVASWTCTKRVMRVWDTVQEHKATVEYDGSSTYMIVEYKDGNVFSVDRAPTLDEAMWRWTIAVNLLTPKTLGKVSQMPLPGFQGLLGDFDIIETSQVAATSYTWKKVA